MGEFIYISYDEKDICDDIKEYNLKDRAHWVNMSGLITGEKIKKQLNMDTSNLSEAEINRYLHGVAVFKNTDCILSEDSLTLYPGSIGCNYHAICDIKITSYENDTDSIIYMSNMDLLGNSKFKYKSINKNGCHTFKCTKEDPVFWKGHDYYGVKFKSSYPIISYECNRLVYVNPSHVNSSYV